MDEQKENFTEEQIKLSYWFIKNKLLLKKIGLGIFIGIDAIFVLYGLYGLMDYLLITGPAENRNLNYLWSETTDFSSLNLRLTALPLDVRSTVLLKSKDVYDAASYVKNRNKDLVARFKYHFALDSGKTETKDGFVLPNETKFITQLGISGKIRATQARLVVEDIRWQRVPPHEIKDYENWAKDHLDFQISGTKFESVPIANQGVASKVSFKVRNLTAYSYWQVGFKIILYRGAAIAGINQAVLSQFKTGEEGSVEATWFEPLGQITKTEIMPEVDIFDEGMFMR